MRIAFYSNFRQMNYCNITAMTVYSIPPQPCHFKTGPPSILPRVIYGFFGNKITIINNYGYSGELHKI